MAARRPDFFTRALKLIENALKLIHKLKRLLFEIASLVGFAILLWHLIQHEFYP